MSEGCFKGCKLHFNTLWLLMCFGCASSIPMHQRPGYVVYVERPRDAPQLRPDPPFVGAVWVDGYWDFDGTDWVWRRGYFQRMPEGQMYERPSWVRQGRGYVRVVGGFRDVRRDDGGELR